MLGVSELALAESRLYCHLSCCHGPANDTVPRSPYPWKITNPAGPPIHFSEKIVNLQTLIQIDL